MAEISRKDFELLVERALRKLPRRFRTRLENIAVVVEGWADDDTLVEMGIEPPDTLYGLYRGTDLTRRDTSYGGVLPDVITIYQGPIEEDCDTVQEMEDARPRHRRPRGRALLRTGRRTARRARRGSRLTGLPLTHCQPDDATVVDFRLTRAFTGY